VAGQTEYLDGLVYLPVWGPQTTTETRLVPFGHARKIYDHTGYEEQLFNFNTRTRMETHAHGVEAEGMKNCFDCMSEIFLLRRYTIKYRHRAEHRWLNEEQLAELDTLAAELVAAPGAPGEQEQAVIGGLETKEKLVRFKASSKQASSTLLAVEDLKYEQIPAKFQALLDAKVGQLSESISTNIATGRTLKNLIMNKSHGNGGWGFHNQNIQKLIDKGHKG
jgi:hypothetical protein